MKTDAVLYLAYEYGAAVGLPASAALNLPVDELLGWVAHQKLKAELISHGD